MSVLTIPQGTTYTATITLKVDGSVIDLSAFSARSQFRKGPNKTSELVLDLTEASGLISISDAANGEIQISLDSVTTAGLDVYTSGSPLYFDVEAFDNSSPPIVYRAASGTVIVTPEVTD